MSQDKGKAGENGAQKFSFLVDSLTSEGEEGDGRQGENNQGD